VPYDEKADIDSSLPGWIFYSSRCSKFYQKFIFSDYHGNRVQIIPDSSARLIAEAAISTYGVSQIRINPMQLKGLSPNARGFAVCHVCANLTLGHLVSAVDNIYDHYNKVGKSDYSVVANFFLVVR
jgi:hypothetical protein